MILISIQTVIATIFRALEYTHVKEKNDLVRSAHVARLRRDTLDTSHKIDLTKTDANDELQREKLCTSVAH